METAPSESEVTGIDNGVDNHIDNVANSTNGSQEPNSKEHQINETIHLANDQENVGDKDQTNLITDDNKDEISSTSASAGSSQGSSSETSPTSKSGGRPSLLTNKSSQYQLVFGMDDTSSEASLTGSPRSLELSNPLLHYGNLAQAIYPPSSVTIEAHELDVKSHDTSCDLASVSHDLSNNRTDSTSNSATGDDASSVFSNSTLLAENRGDSSASAGLVTNERHSVRDESDVTLATNDQSNSTCVTTTDQLSSLEKNTSTADTGRGSPDERSNTQTPDSDLRLEDIALRSRSSGSVSPVDGATIKPKLHPLSVLTSDSEAESEPTPYVPVKNTSGDEDNGSSSMPSPLGDNDTIFGPPAMSILFSGVTYLGSSSVDAPISEIEANRKMFVLKEQASISEPIPVVLSVPMANHGSVILVDPKTEQPMATYPVKMILFCARGNAETLLDCFCLNVKNRRSGMYHCHVFRCDIMDACNKVFQAIGKAFKTKPLDQSQPPLTGDEVNCNFEVAIDIHEDDSKGGYAPVPMDKDCFKLRQNTRKKVTLTVSQPNSERPLMVERCFGLLISPGKDVKVSEMNLLDNMVQFPLT